MESVNAEEFWKDRAGSDEACPDTSHELLIGIQLYSLLEILHSETPRCCVQTIPVHKPPRESTHRQPEAVNNKFESDYVALLILLCRNFEHGIEESCWLWICDELSHHPRLRLEDF